MNATIETEESRKGRPSASGIYRLIKCPGSWIAESKCPPDEESQEAAVGTYLHACMESHQTPDDPEQAEVIEACYRIEAELVADVFGDEEGLAVIREERMFASDENGETLFSGKPDVIYYSPHTGTALIIDYKFGRLPVDSVEQNRQLAALAVLFNRESKPAPSVVCAGIIQPYVSRQKPRLVRFLPEHLEAADKFICASIKAAENPDAPLNPDEKACRYCRALSSCPAVSLTLANVTANDLTSSWERLSPEARKQAYDYSRVAKKFAAVVETKLKADLKAGMDIPGLTLSPGKKAFAITDASKAFFTLNGLYPEGITPESFTACCKVGITELDKLVHTVRKGEDAKTKIADSREWLRNTLADCAEVKVSDGSIKETGATK